MNKFIFLGFISAFASAETLVKDEIKVSFTQNFSAKDSHSHDLDEIYGQFNLSGQMTTAVSEQLIPLKTRKYQTTGPMPSSPFTVNLVKQKEKLKIQFRFKRSVIFETETINKDFEVPAAVESLFVDESTSRVVELADQDFQLRLLECFPKVRLWAQQKSLGIIRHLTCNLVSKNSVLNCSGEFRILIQVLTNYDEKRI